MPTTKSAGFQAFDWYDTPRYYDLVFDVDTLEQADFLEALHAGEEQAGAEPGQDGREDDVPQHGARGQWQGKANE